MKRTVLYHFMTLLLFVLLLKTLMNEDAWWLVALFYLGFIGFFCTSITSVYNAFKKKRT